MSFLSLADQIQLNIPHIPRDGVIMSNFLYDFLSGVYKLCFIILNKNAKGAYICIDWVPFSMGGKRVDYVFYHFAPA